MFEYYKPGSSAESMFEMENRNNDRRMWGCGKRRSSQQRDFRMGKPTATGAAASATARVAMSATARWSWWRLKSRRGEKGKGINISPGWTTTVDRLTGAVPSVSDTT
ncbi:hypothetical protein LXL04_016431 [Taraxacum kok-saghyz]